ncbi:MAG: hypothetical protein AB1640_13800 [bacterium]
MRIGYHLKRAQEVVGSLSLAREFVSHDRWTIHQIREYQDQRMRSLVKYAIEHSPFYREFYARIDPDKPYDYESLPVLTKKIMMDNYDRFVTDSKLKIHDLQEHVHNLTRDEYYLGSYRVLSTGGSSGLTGFFAFNRSEWRTLIGAWQRAMKYLGYPLRLPNRWKVAFIGARHPRHMSSRLTESSDLGLLIMLRLSASEPLEEMVKALNEFQPEILSGYPSIEALLAQEQLEGRLNIHPSIVACSAEILAEDMKQKIRAAWGKNPFNMYLATEVVTLGVTCSQDRGIHVFEDLAILEVVDENNRRVPDGVLGNRVLLTNLHYFTQPLIRYELTDMLKVFPEPCPCGRPFPLLEAIEGRSDDILELEGFDCRTVSVHPITFRSALGKTPGLRQYQVVQRQGDLHFNLVALDHENTEELSRKVESIMTRNLEDRGVKCPPPLTSDWGKMKVSCGQDEWLWPLTIDGLP